MSVKISIRIDRFYIVMVVLLVVLATLVALTFREVFSAFAEAGRIEQELLEASAPRVNKEDLNKAYELGVGKRSVPLDLRQ